MHNRLSLVPLHEMRVVVWPSDSSKDTRFRCEPQLAPKEEHQLQVDMGFQETDSETGKILDYSVV